MGFASPATMEKTALLPLGLVGVMRPSHHFGFKGEWIKYFFPQFLHTELHVWAL